MTTLLVLQFLLALPHCGKVAPGPPARFSSAEEAAGHAATSNATINYDRSPWAAYRLADAIKGICQSGKYKGFPQNCPAYYHAKFPGSIADEFMAKTHRAWQRTKKPFTEVQEGILCDIVAARRDSGRYPVPEEGKLVIGLRLGDVVDGLKDRDIEKMWETPGTLTFASDRFLHTRWGCRARNRGTREPMRLSPTALVLR